MGNSSIHTNLGERPPTDLRAQLGRYAAQERSCSWTHVVAQALKDWAVRETGGNPAMLADPPDAQADADLHRDEVQSWSEGLGADRARSAR